MVNNMEEKEVEIQEFNGKDYFLYDSVMTKNNIYDIFAAIENPKEIVVAKQVMKQEEIYYEIVKEEERDEIISLCQNKNN